mmetsp:Transcript_15539/g.36770  ORF Transcript_15539/g.36770 Transcript_15539/m.36770 type:complete len:238 (-) Transcript_15539:92-805(-)
MASSKDLALYAALPASLCTSASTFLALRASSSGVRGTTGAFGGAAFLAAGGSAGPPSEVMPSVVWRLTPMSMPITERMRWSPRCLEIELGSLLSSSIFCMNDGSISSGAVCGLAAIFCSTSGALKTFPSWPIPPDSSCSIAFLASARPLVSMASAGSIFRPSSYAAIALSNWPCPCSAAPLRPKPLGQVGAFSMQLSASLSASLQLPIPPWHAERLLYRTWSPPSSIDFVKNVIAFS